MPPRGGTNNNHAKKGDRKYKAGKKKETVQNKSGMSGFSGEQKRDIKAGEYFNFHIWFFSRYGYENTQEDRAGNEIS